MDKRIKCDQEVLDLVKEWQKVLLKDTTIKYSQANALKIALRKVLLK